MDLKSLDEAKRRVGGAFRLSVLLQKRIIELVRGASPVVETNGEKLGSPIDIALREILEGKISLEMIPKEEFDRLVEEARLEKEGRVAATREDDAFTPSSSMPTIELARDPVGSSNDD